MSFTPRTRLVNPRLGAYFGIFASAFAGLVILLLIFEQLGASDPVLRLTMLAGPIVLYAAIGIAALTRDPLDYFASGRRVPAVYTGLGLAVTAMGATGLVAFTGLFFLIGFDALFMMIGGLAGFVLMAVLLAPFLRKFGAYTLSSYLGRRFDSRALRILSAAAFSIPLLLFAAAELRLGALAAAHLTGRTEQGMLSVMVMVLVATLILGGMRSLTWSSAAQSIAVMLALLVPASIVAVLVTNFPLPQLSHGPLLRALVRSEVLQALPMTVPNLLDFDMPGEGLSTIAKRFTQPYGSVGPFAFSIATLTVMAGVACAPWLLPRVAASPGVYEARKSLGWATCFFGVLMLTVTAVAVFMRDAVNDVVMVEGVQQVPGWLKELSALGFAEVDTQSTRIAMTSIRFNRDTVYYSLPVVIGLPSIFIYLTMAGAVAAALAAAGATLVSFANLLSEDIFNGLSWEPQSSTVRIGSGRIALAAGATFAGLMAFIAPADPVRLMLWALALTASSAAAVLVLSIWWKRINTFGAIAGITTGFIVALGVILAGALNLITLDGALAGLVGMPASLLATIAASLLTPGPSKHQLELVRDIRVPGGEILYDREMRLLRLKRRK